MSERPGIAEIADRLISHMDRSRRLYVLLIASSLALAVTSLAFMALVLSPGAVPAGPAYEYYGGMPGAYEGVFEGRLLGSADGPAGPFYGEFVGEFDGEASAMYGEFAGSFDGTFDDLYDGAAPGGELGVFEGRFEGVFYGEFYGLDDHGEFAGSLGDAPVGYPAAAVPSAGQPGGIAPALAAFVGVIAAMSLLVLYVGLRESMFYSDWAPRFKKYREQRDAIDRELGSPEGEADATPSS